MNVKRFTARTSREALALVKQEFGDDAVVMSTRPCPEGVEVVAMAGDSIEQLERVGAAAEWVQAPRQPAPAAQRPTAAPQRRQPPVEPEFDESATPQPSWAATAPKPAPSRLEAAARLLTRARQRLEPRLDEPPAATPPRGAVTQESPIQRVLSTRGAVPGRLPAASQPAIVGAQSVQTDVEQLQMSTLSFQDYVRQRMLKRREAELAAEAAARAPARAASYAVNPPATSVDAARQRQQPAHRAQPAVNAQALPVLRDEITLEQIAASAAQAQEAEKRLLEAQRQRALQQADLAQRAHQEQQPVAVQPAPLVQRREQTEMMSELRSMRGLIEQRFGALAFMEKLQRQPRQAQLAQTLLAAGFSPGLIRRLVDGLPNDVDERSWAATVLERNLVTAQDEPSLEEQGGVFALIGATGVGKTTSTAKLAAAFAARYGAANLGLVTLDAYRVGAHEQLRTYGRILGVPVHTAHDRASLEDLLELLSAKRMVLIDTAGMAQRDSRTRELLEMVSHRSIKRLLVINSSAQGETIEDQLAAYGAAGCSGVILSKLDEAVKLGPALDSMIRHRLKVLAVANGQRVPEDWHRLSASALVQRALKGGGSAAWTLSDNDVNLIFAGLPSATMAEAGRPAAAVGASA